MPNFLVFSNTETVQVVPVQHFFISQSVTFTGTSTGTVIDLSTNPLSRFSIQVTGTGALPTLWTVLVEGSLDNSSWTTILTHTNVTGNGLSLSMGASNFPVLYVRLRCTGLTLGLASNIVVKLVGVN